jgi:hypothetical protein
MTGSRIELFFMGKSFLHRDVKAGGHKGAVKVSKNQMLGKRTEIA